jgi:hypothetical protein
MQLESVKARWQVIGKLSVLKIGARYGSEDVQEWFCAERGSGVFEDNLHALAIIGAQHTDRILQLAKRHYVAHQRLQANRSTLHQRD